MSMLYIKTLVAMVTVGLGVRLDDVVDGDVRLDDVVDGDVVKVNSDAHDEADTLVNSTSSAGITAESYNGDYLSFWPPGYGSNKMWTPVTNFAPVQDKVWFEHPKGAWKSAPIVNDAFDLGEIIPGGGQKGVILTDGAIGQFIFWPSTGSEPAKLWKSNAAKTGSPLCYRSWTQYKRSDTMIGTTMCAVTATGGFVCTNTNGDKSKGAFYPNANKDKLLWMWGQAAQLLSFGPIYFPGNKVVLWKTLETFSTINAHGYCGSDVRLTRHDSSISTVLEHNAGANKCARWAQSNSECGSDFHYSSTTNYCECVPRGQRCVQAGGQSYGYGAYHFDSAAAEVARRISLNPNGKRGKACTMSLSWNTKDDLDLYLTGGAYKISYRSKKQKEHGKVVAELNIDANSNSRTSTSTPVENIVTHVAKVGTYTLTVKPARRNEKIAYDLVVVCLGAKMRFNGVEKNKGEFISASGITDTKLKPAIEFNVVG